MKVGRHHHWSQRQRVYEKKIGPGKWRYRYTGYKRQRAMPGVGRGSRYTWYHTGTQKARKVRPGLYRVSYSGYKYLKKAKRK